MESLPVISTARRYIAVCNKNTQWRNFKLCLPRPQTNVRRPPVSVIDNVTTLSYPSSVDVT